MEITTGSRYTTNYANSNASHYGFFALLYGRSPLDYFEALEEGEPPTLPWLLQQWGWSSHYLSCADLRWRQMERFLGRPHFEAHLHRGSLDRCDADVVASARAILREPADGPRLLLAFLMSTHFSYHYPPDVARFEPAAPPINALDDALERDRPALWNRYRNSAAHLDRVVGELLDAVDLENTVVIVTGDHGEALFDDGTLAHSSLLSEIQTRVPMVMLGVGGRPGSVVGRTTSHIDVLPTLLSRLGLDERVWAGLPGRPLTREPLRGESPAYAPLVHAKGLGGGRERLALVSGERRYGLRLGPGGSGLLFLGPLDDRGRPTGAPVSDSEAQDVLVWLEDLLVPSEARH